MNGSTAKGREGRKAAGEEEKERRKKKDKKHITIKCDSFRASEEHSPVPAARVDSSPFPLGVLLEAAQEAEEGGEDREEEEVLAVKGEED